jgi:hypothetical protein
MSPIQGSFTVLRQPHPIPSTHKPQPNHNLNPFIPSSNKLAIFRSRSSFLALATSALPQLRDTAAGIAVEDPITARATGLPGTLTLPPLLTFLKVCVEHHSREH